MGKDLAPCFVCRAPSHVEMHHVVPRSIIKLYDDECVEISPSVLAMSVALIPLCKGCHDLVSPSRSSIIDPMFVDWVNDGVASEKLPRWAAVLMLRLMATGIEAIARGDVLRKKIEGNG